MPDDDLMSRVAAAPAAPPPAPDFEEAPPAADGMYEQACGIVLASGKASTSYIQRKLTINYNRAAGIIERMEAKGLVTTPNHKGVREITQKMRDTKTPALPETEVARAEETGRIVADITVDMNKNCAECGQPGAVDNGLCLGCTAAAMRSKPLASEIGKSVQARFHNMAERSPQMAKSGFAKDQLKSFINRIERLEEERAALSADIKEVYSEAKGTGFDTKIMRQVIRMRKLDKADFQEQEAMLDLYLIAMDMR